MKSIIPTVVTAIASIIAAAFTAYATIRAADTRIQKIQDQASTLEDLTRLPVGTVLASMLEPKDFAVVVGDPADYDPQKTRWTLADDKGRMPGTKWAQLTDNQPIPDLRGMFLRGLNHGRTDQWSDPEKDRKPGGTQMDELKSHTHGYGSHAGPGQASATAGDARIQQEPPGAFQTHTNVPNSPETRPKNAAVYYYIRVR